MSCYYAIVAVSGPTETWFVTTRNGDAMLPEEVRPPGPEPSAKGEEPQSKESPVEDPDTARRAAFKKMLPDPPRKNEPEKPSE